MTELPDAGLLGHWPGTVAPGGRLYDRSPEDNHGSHGPTARWIWFTNPRAVRHVGRHDRTYVGYLGGVTGEDIVVGTCDRTAGRFEETTLATDVSSDDHVGPAVFARNDGHLLAFWSEHDGPWMKYRITDAPEAPDTFGPVRQLDGEAVCYPNPVQPGDDPGAPIYLFYRDRAGTGDGHPHYRVSTDGGESFSEPTRLVTAPDGHYSVYWMAAGRDGEIHLFFTDAEGPSTGPKWNVAYARFDDGALAAADGTPIADEADLPVAVDDLEIVYDARDDDRTDAWIWDSGVDADGNPAAVYVTFPTTHTHTYRYARFDGSEWTQRTIVDAGRYVGADPMTGYFSGGMAMPTRNPDVVYASVTRGEHAVLERFETDDAGRTFASETVTPRPVSDNLRPVVPENASPDVPVVWLAGAYNHLDGSQTVLRGVPGPVTTGGPLTGEGHHGASLGIDCYRSAVFDRGLTLGVAFETGHPDRPQTVVDLGGCVRIEIAADEPGSIACSFDGTADAARCTVEGVTAGRRHRAVGWWDGETARFRLDDGAGTGADFEGPLALDEERRGWTIGKPSHFNGTGIRGAVAGVALYNRPLPEQERRAVRTGIDPD